MNTVSPQMSESGYNQYTSSRLSNAAVKKVPARLCYVDDSRTSAYVVKRMLRPYGYAVDHFESAEPALVALVQDNYDLLLTDLKVSQDGMDGDDLVRALRNSGHDKISGMPVIVITGATDSDLLSQVYDAGANYILTKPVNGDELDAEIRKLVFTRKHSGDEDIAEQVQGIESAGATVVQFDAEAKKSAETADIIPVLNTDKTIQSATVRAKESYKSAPRTAKRNVTSEERRVLRPNDDEATSSESTDSNSRVRTSEHKPAARVKPTVRVKTRSVTLKAKTATRLTTPVTDRQKNVSAQRKVALTRAKTIHAAAIVKKARLEAAKNSAVSPATSKATTTRTSASAAAARVNQATAKVKQDIVKKRVAAKIKIDVKDKAEALRKVKASIAAKKAKLMQQQREIEAQLASNKEDLHPEDVPAKTVAPKASATATTKAPNLSLEPKENEPADIFNVQQEVQSTIQKAVEQQAAQQQISQKAAHKPAEPVVPEKQKPAVPEVQVEAKPQVTPQEQPAQAAQPEKEKDSPKVEDVLAAFQQTGSNQPDILQTMEQYPLVETDFGSNYSPSRMLRMVNSVLELYGPKRILSSVAMLGMALVIYGGWSGYVDKGMPVQTTKVKQGEIFQSITVPGRVVSKLRVNMTPSIAGRVTNIYVEEGDHIEAGDLLARLDDREAKSYLTRAKANYEGAKEDVVLATRSLKRLKQAFDKGAIARQLVEDSEVELRSAKARQSIASEEVRTAKLSLENPRVVAPFSGTVTARFVEVGQWVVPSETLFALVDESQREIEVRVDAADSGGIAVAQTVNISSDAFPGLNWSESVTRLAAATSNVGNANTVSVYISLGNSAPSLRFGQQVDADIRTAWNPNALKVPYSTVVNKDGASYIIVLEDGRAKYVQVETGIEDFSHVEILQGVNVGQTIVLANGQDISNGQKIMLAANGR